MIHIASSEGAEEHLKEILEAGVERINEPDDTDPNKMTPLALACQNGHCACAELLLINGATLAVQNADGMSPLHHASHRGHQDIVQALLRARAYPNCPDVDGSTPLHMAAEEGHAPCVELLIEAGAALGREDADGACPLILSCRGGHAACCTALLEAHADPLCECAGVSALTEARLSLDARTMTLLEDAVEACDVEGWSDDSELQRKLTDDELDGLDSDSSSEPIPQQGQAGSSSSSSGVADKPPGKAVESIQDVPAPAPGSIGAGKRVVNVD